MDTHKITQEQISALADGELADDQVDATLAALRRPDGQDSWEMYHQIGDMLRSDDMDVELSPNFSARMAARLAAEPTIIAPAAVRLAKPVIEIETEEAASVAAPAKRAIKRFAIPGMLAAGAAAAFAFIATPQLMVATNSTRTPVSTPTAGPVVLAASAKSSGPAPALAIGAPAAKAAVPAADVVLRDPRIDEYLLAHQRFSPSVYSTAQYARSATSATESDNK